MKRLLVLAALALMVTGTAFAQAPNQCDIVNSPAATLLLPYFSVDFANADRTTAVDTIFTVTNVSDIPAIAHVTVWSDWSFPVLDFNLFLTGYDVVGVSMYDILNRGTIPSTTIAGTTTGVSPVGARSIVNSTSAVGNPNFSSSALTACLNQGGQGVIPSQLLAQIRSGLTGGGYFTCAQVGDAHTNAVGYVTVDVANTCSQSLPITETYYTTEILFDNQLIGDYQRINPSNATGNFAGGNPMVHIKAVPGGGPIGSFPSTLPVTFYDRYTPDANRQADRRQPLPALFAGRYIGAGSGFSTQYLIWREGNTGSDSDNDCTDYDANSSMPYNEVVRFDERENPFTQTTNCPVSPCITPTVGLPETSAQSITGTSPSPIFPPNTASTDGGGWTYFNLDNPVGGANFSNPARASQNWVVVEMTAEGRYGVDFDAAYLGNGCTPAIGTTVSGRTGTPKIGPQFQ
jgi:hypothetical protein